MSVRSTRITFRNDRGLRLAGLLDEPGSQPARAYALFAHCFTCNKNYKGVRNLCRALAAAGIGVLRFDFTGLGESEGDFSTTTFSDNIADILAAAHWLETHHAAPQLLIGHSLGGTAMLLAASRLQAVKAVATVASPSEPAHVLTHFADRQAQILQQGEAEIRIGGVAYRIRRPFVEDVQAHDLKAVLPGLKRALLILHAPGDETVSVEHAARLFALARHPKSFVSLDGADHLLSRPEDARYAGGLIAAWAQRYLVTDQASDRAPAASSASTARESPATAVPAGKDDVVVTIGRDHYHTEIRARHHEFTADEPLRAGGGDQGPTPYELLCAALGACTAITLRMYADRKSWPLESVRVVLRHAKVHVQDCRECPDDNAQKNHAGKGGWVDRIERRLSLRGDLSDAQRERLLAIADRCPVHRSLQEKILIETCLDSNVAR